MTDILGAGVDLGSTGLKMLVVDASGAEVAMGQVPTPWRAGPGGTTDMDAEALLTAVHDLLTTVSHRVARSTTRPIGALALSGMGETGFLIDEQGAAAAPAIAWFDPRGLDEVRAFPAQIREEFAGRTGLPLGAQVSVAKLAYLRGTGLPLRGLRWLNLPEFVATDLGGETALERSLTSRTGLIDKDTGQPWPALLDLLGLDETFLPPLRTAGAGWGRLTADLPANVAGARLTVAGHDHLVAAVAGGLSSTHRYYVSIGTAEVLLRVIDAPLGFEARSRLAEHLINEVEHLVPGKHVLVAGVKTGLLLRRTLQAVGIRDQHGRAALDTAVMELPYQGRLAPDAIEVTGARNDDGVLRLTLHTDGASPAEVFGAVLRHSNEEIKALIAAMDRELPPAREATLTGGWAGMESVRRARAQVLPNLTVSEREQETAYGAALAALRLLPRERVSP